MASLLILHITHIPLLSCHAFVPSTALCHAPCSTQTLPVLKPSRAIESISGPNTWPLILTLVLALLCGTFPAYAGTTSSEPRFGTASLQPGCESNQVLAAVDRVQNGTHTAICRYQPPNLDLSPNPPYLHRTQKYSIGLSIAYRHHGEEQPCSLSNRMNHLHTIKFIGSSL